MAFRKSIIHIITGMSSYAAIILASLTITFILMQLWRADMRVPFEYGTDALMHSEWVKSVIDGGWYLDNTYIGMPSGKNWRDFPMSENLHYAIIKLLTLFSSDYALVLNCFFILTFTLAAATAYYVFRSFMMHPAASFAGALLFAFQHYHWYRGESHLFLSAYYMIPLIVMVIIWLIMGRFDVLLTRDRGKPILQRVNLPYIGGIVIAFLVSMSGIYYAFFSTVFLLTAGAARSLWKRSIFPLATAAVLAGTIVFGGIVSLAPTIVYNASHGKNTVSYARVYHEVELYSLKVTELLLPAVGHRSAALAALRDKYDRESSFLYRFKGEGDSTSLGFIAAAGFMFLIAFVALYSRRGTASTGDRWELAYVLGILNLAALLMSTVGGFNSFMAPLVGYKIRAYNRLSIFIAFFAIFAIVLIMTEVYERYIKGRGLLYWHFRKGAVTVPALSLLSAVFLAMVLAGGLYDQAGRGSLPDYESVKKQFYSDRIFVKAIERTVPPGTMVFQLPYLTYPYFEIVPKYRMGEYDHLRCYLHTTKLRWSFGAVYGRSTDAWQRQTSSKPVPAMIAEITRKGFGGILVNRNGYADNGEKIIAEIQSMLHAVPVKSSDGTMVFLSL